MKTINILFVLIAFFLVVTNVNAQLVAVENPLPTITVQPVDDEVCENGAAVFIINANCVGGVTYQWQVDNGGGFVNTSDGPTYAGSMTNTLNIASAGISMDAYQYQCIVTSVTGGCDITSVIATLTIDPLATITLQPITANACENGNTSFTITALAVGGVTYQWQVDDGGGFVNLANGGYYSGVATNTLSLTSVDMSLDNYDYLCVVTTTIGSCPINSNSAELIVNPLAVVSVDPVSTSTCENGDATFNVTASVSAGSLTYQWQVDDGGGMVNITGATSSTLFLSGVTSAMDNYIYQCVVTTSVGSCTTTSATAILTVNPLATITIHPAADVACDGANANFDVTASAVGGVTYQWQQNSGSGWANLAEAGIYSGTTTANLVLTGVTYSMNGYSYRCVVTTTIGSCPINSNSASLTVNPLPLSQTVKANGITGTTGSYCQGGAGVIFSLTSSQNTFDYELQDFATSNPISNVTGTGSSIAFPAVPAGFYKIEVTSGLGCTTVIQ